MKSTAKGVTASILDLKATDMEQEQEPSRAQSESASLGEHQSFVVHGGMDSQHFLASIVVYVLNAMLIKGKKLNFL